MAQPTGYFRRPILPSKHRILVTKYFMSCLHCNYTAEMSVLKQDYGLGIWYLGLGKLLLEVASFYS